MALGIEVAKRLLKDCGAETLVDFPLWMGGSANEYGIFGKPSGLVVSLKFAKSDRLALSLRGCASDNFYTKWSERYGCTECARS